MNKILAFPCLLFPLLVLTLLASRSADAQVATQTPLMTRALPDVPGREGLIERVDLAPGEVSPVHRHNADVFAHVLEGRIITQVESRESLTVHSGEVFHESPTDLHRGSRNASTTEPATLLVFFVKKVGAPSTTKVP